MSDESDFDDAAHENLLRQLTGQEKRAIKKGGANVHEEDLLAAIHSTRNVKGAKVGVKRSRVEKQALQPPLDRRQREKLEGSVAYTELKNELDEWAPIVHANRISEKILFPLEKPDLRTQTASERSAGFKPKTQLEFKMAEILGKSKHNLRNEELYTKAEMEIIKAMSLKEAKEKCAQLQKMRALMSYREAKFKRQAKIKSKQYHRIQKRQKRRRLLKEFNELLTRDPEAAKEKLKEMEEERILERATLKHRGGNRFSKELAKHAARDPKTRALLEEQLRLGRELKSKVRADSDTDSGNGEDQPAAASSDVLDLIQGAAEAIAMEKHRGNEESSSFAEDLVLLRRERKRKLEEARRNGAGKQEPLNDQSKPLVETVSDSLAAVKTAQHDDAEARLKKKKKTTKSGLIASSSFDVDEEFENVSKKLLEKVSHEVFSSEETKKMKSNQKKKVKVQEKPTTTEPATEEKDARIDPNAYLQHETSALTQVSADLVDGMSQAEIIADAFRDDDVIREFEDEKARMEEDERPKDVDLRLAGWGSWTGPGIRDKVKERFIVKATIKSRKDRGKNGLIIKETYTKCMGELQPRSVPFPYTNATDYEAVIRQPIGRDWNTQTSHKKLIEPNVVTEAGRIIRPLNKKDFMGERIETSDD